MEIEEAHRFITQRLRANPGRFYRSCNDLPLGAGIVLSNVRFPEFSAKSRLYATRRGPVLVLTHECDIDQTNQRPLNDQAMVAPLIAFEDFIENWHLGDPELESFLGHLGNRLISRAVYIPCYKQQFLEFGALVNFNFLASIPVIELNHTDATKEISLTEYGLNEVDKMLEPHFLRPKA